MKAGHMIMRRTSIPTWAAASMAFFKEEGISDEARAQAIEEVRTWQLREAVKGLRR